MVFKWNEENTLLFLKHFRGYQYLWNQKLDGYKEKTLRKKSIQSLISDLNLGVTEDDIKHKIKTIRTRYAVELSKINNSIKSGCSSENVYVPKLYWFKHADFLRSVCVPRPSTSNLDEEENTQDIQKEECNGAVEVEIVPKKQSQDYSPAPKTTNSESSGLTPIRRKRKIDMPINRTIKESKGMSEQNKQEVEDELDLFCKNLAVQLKKIPLERVLLCKEKLQSVMTQEFLALTQDDLVKTSEI